MAMKICVKCKEEKSLEEFNKRSDIKDGFSNRCKICDRAFNREWRHRNPEKIKAIQYRQSRTFQGRFASARSSAKKRGIAWELTLDQFRELVRWGWCSYCSSEVSPGGSGLDRIDNSKGYILGNVTPCCGKCNTAKAGMTQREFAGFITRVCLHWWSQVVTDGEINEMSKILIKKRYIETIDGVYGSPEESRYEQISKGKDNSVENFISPILVGG